MKKHWYHFWKRSGPTGGYDETFKCYDEGKDTKDWLNDFAESWAGKVGGGFNTTYSYGWKTIDKPPTEWLEKQLENSMSNIEYYNKQVKFYSSLLE
jgi:hypothetical protein